MLRKPKVKTYQRERNLYIHTPIHSPLYDEVPTTYKRSASEKTKNYRFTFSSVDDSESESPRTPDDLLIEYWKKRALRAEEELKLCNMLWRKIDRFKKKLYAKYTTNITEKFNDGNTMFFKSRSYIDKNYKNMTNNDCSNVNSVDRLRLPSV